MKGIIFAGCSFTWGQGLYFYSDLPDVPRIGDSDFHPSLLKDSHIKFKDTLRFPRLVANHFNTFEIVKKQNGGNDEQSIEFIYNLFNDTNNQYGKFKYDNFDYLIFQTSQIVRNRFKFEYRGKSYNINAPQKKLDLHSVNDIIFFKWLSENNIDYDQWCESFKLQIITKIKSFLTFIEENGIKTKLLLWQDDLINLVEEDTFLSEKFLILHHEDKKYNCIDHLIKTNRGMTIKDDNENLINPVHDTHPSKKCHKIIANSIIKNIEKDLI